QDERCLAARIEEPLVLSANLARGLGAHELLDRRHVARLEPPDDRIVEGETELHEERAERLRLVRSLRRGFFEMIGDLVQPRGEARRDEVRGARLPLVDGQLAALALGLAIETKELVLAPFRERNERGVVDPLFRARHSARVEQRRLLRDTRCTFEHRAIARRERAPEYPLPIPQLLRRRTPTP